MLCLFALASTGCEGQGATESDDPQGGASAESQKAGKGAKQGDTQKPKSSNPKGSDQEDPKGDKGNPSPSKDWDKLVAKVFPDDRVVSIGITFQEKGLQDMLEDWRRSKKKSYQETTVNWDGLSLPGAGTRLKGYSTLMSATGGFPGGPGGGGSSAKSKLPLKINFDRFGGERLHHLDKVSLGTNAFDKSHMRERLSVNMFRKMGVPAAKTAFAEVSLNQSSVGLYTITQNINKRFLKQHFGTKDSADDGNLYKCVSLKRQGGGSAPGSGDLVCSLRWQGDQKSDYLRSKGCATGYETCGLVLKTNEGDKTKSDYADLIHFLDVLNHSKDEAFEDAILEVFDVDSFLRFLAVSVTMVNLDSYLGRVNNFYLYHRPDTGKFMMLPWDLNMSYGHYGRVRGLSDLIEFPVRDPLAKQVRRDNHILVERILKVPAFKTKYLAYLREFVDEHFTVEVHRAMIKSYQALIQTPLEEDPTRKFSMEQFELSLGEEQGGASTGMGRQYNLLNFVMRRRAFVLDSL